MTQEREINSSIGEKIVLLRKQKGLSRVKLARVLKITHQQLDKYERGTNRISAGKLAIICKELNINPSFFYFNLSAKNNITKSLKSDLNTLVSLFIQIDKNSKREIIINIAKELISNNTKELLS